MAQLKDIKLFGDRIMIKPDEAKKVSDGGIVLSASAQEKSQTGTVVLIGLGKKTILGDGFERIPIDVQIDDRVQYTKYSGVDYVHESPDGEKTHYLIITEKDIIMAFPPDHKS